jgi:hypothetical protein
MACRERDDPRDGNPDRRVFVAKSCRSAVQSADSHPGADDRVEPVLIYRQKFLKRVGASSV